MLKFSLILPQGSFFIHFFFFYINPFIMHCFNRMLLFGKKVTRVKDNDQPEVLLVIQSESCLKLHQILNQVASEFAPDQNIKSVQWLFILN